MHVSDALAQGAKCLAFGALCIVYARYLIVYADPRRDDALQFRRGTFIRRAQVPGWLYRFLTFSGLTEDSVAGMTSLNVGQGIFWAGLGIALALYGIFVMVRGPR